MRRFQLGLAMLAVPVFALSVFIAGCGKDDKKDQSSGGGSGGDVKENPSKGPAKWVEAKGGVLKGKVSLKSPPNIDKLTQDLQAEISKNQNKDFCMKGSPSEVTAQKYRIGKNGNLGNVFVWIRPAQGTLFKVDKQQLENAKKNPVKIHQPHCAFIPHCAVAWVEYYADDKNPTKKTPTGQTIEIHNDASVSHNTNYAAGPRNPHDDQTILPNGKPMVVENLQADTAPMKLKCGIHGWMDGWIRLVDTPYYAITYSDTLDGKDKVEPGDAKFGTYEIKNLPVGKVLVTVWHEDANYLNKNEGRGEEIEILEGKETEKNFEK